MVVAGIPIVDQIRYWRVLHCATQKAQLIYHQIAYGKDVITAYSLFDDGMFEKIILVAEGGFQVHLPFARFVKRIIKAGIVTAMFLDEPARRRHFMGVKDGTPLVRLRRFAQQRPRAYLTTRERR